MSLVEDALDFIAFIIVLGVSLAVAFGVVIPIVNEKEDLSSNTLIDKSSPLIKGTELESSYDGTLSKLEVILMTQVQDSDIPKPQRFVVKNPANNSVLDVNIGALGATYRSGYNLNKYGTETKNLLSSDNSATFKYKVGYHYGATKKDDFYVIEKVR